MASATGSDAHFFPRASLLECGGQAPYARPCNTSPGKGAWLPSEVAHWRSVSGFKILKGRRQVKSSKRLAPQGHIRTVSGNSPANQKIENMLLVADGGMSIESL